MTRHLVGRTSPLAIAFAFFAAAVTAALALGAPCTMAADAAAPTSTPRVATVAVLLTPFLTWSDLSPQRTPQLWSLAESGAIGNMNSMTADKGGPTPAGGALTISASRWAAGPVGAPADASALAAVRSANAGSLDLPDIGALGSVLHAHGFTTAAVGNADEDTSTPAGVRRPAELVVADRFGYADHELTASGLLSADARAPFGVRTNRTRLRTATLIALADKPSLLVVDPGDLERAHDATFATAELAQAAHAEAVSELDADVGDLRRALGGTSAILLVVTPAADKPYYQPPFLGPTIVAGAGFRGELMSPSTHRPGLVTNLDVAPTVLSALGAEPTSTMVGQRLSAYPDPSSTQALVARLDRLNISVGAVDFLRDLIFIPAFAWACGVVALAAAAALALSSSSRLRTASRWLILLALAIPSGAWLMFALDRYPLSAGAAAMAFVIATLGVFAVAATARLRRTRAEVVMVSFTSLISLLICADQWMGHPFETGLFSYSIRGGWRYYGMGNEGAALLVGASIAAVGLACDLSDGKPWQKLAHWGLMPVVGVVVLLTAAAPFAGANAGVAVWGVVAFGVAWLRVNRVRVTWGRAAGILATIVAIVAVFVALDLASGAGETHLGRFFAEAVSGEFSPVMQLIYRKAANNIGYITQTPYTGLAVALVGALGLARFAPGRPLVSALAARPGLSGAIVGVLIGAAAATLTEDSGVVMPALMLFAAELPVLYVALDSRISPPAAANSEKWPATRS